MDKTVFVVAYAFWPISLCGGIKSGHFNEGGQGVVHLYCNTMKRYYYSNDQIVFDSSLKSGTTFDSDHAL